MLIFCVNTLFLRRRRWRCVESCGQWATGLNVNGRASNEGLLLAVATYRLPQCHGGMITVPVGLLASLLLAARVGLSDRGADTWSRLSDDGPSGPWPGVPGLDRETDTVLYGRLSTDRSSSPPRRLLAIHLEQEIVTVTLRPVNDLVSSQFSVWVRNESGVTEDQLVPLPTCLYAGHQVTVTGSQLDMSVSTCGGEQGDTAALLGNVILDGEHYVLKPDGRVKRQVGDDGTSLGQDHQEVLVVQTAAGGGECGLNTRNKKRLRVEERPVVKLAEDPTRTKRSTTDRYIEVAVFVDNVMYSNVDAKKSPGEDTLKKIRDIVFAYLNAVQIMYRSALLTNKLNLVLVRLDIMQTADPSLDKHTGDIERYLEAFCQWQKGKNPGASASTADRTNGAHWDHALLLTGLNLYDGVPARDSVIGLAWVSGMCTPEFSCTINEGNNFESVFVIAHEMGHNLGMNHDGERSEGNTCSPDRYLMSPVLGPGKVTWSTCSDQELTSFLTSGPTRAQVSCLEDKPDLRNSYNFNPSGKAPGELFSAMDQCRQAFGASFRPHLRSESPFEDLCRELWCSNRTHALRAHPALEGTDCNSKPFPYGSACHEGVCLPFVPGASGYGVLPNSTVVGAADSGTFSGNTDRAAQVGQEDCPAWFDPIFTRVFTRLRAKFAQLNPLLGSMPARTGRPGAFGVQEMNDTAQQIELDMVDIGAGNSGEAGRMGEDNVEAVWQMALQDCPVQCGGGWAGVYHTCQYSGGPVDVSHCELLPPPLTQAQRLPCATQPCNITHVF